MWKQLLIGGALVACDQGSKPAPPPKDPLAGIELAIVPSKIDDVANAPIVSVSKTAIVVDGKTIVPIANGKVDDAEKEGGEIGIRIPKLVTALLAQPQQDTLVLALDRTTPYQMLISTMFTAESQPLTYRRFAIMARAKDTGAPTALLILMLSYMKPSTARLDTPDDDGSLVDRHSNGKISVDNAGGESSLTPDVVFSKIQAVYLGGIRRCYTAELARDATAHGSVKLQFSVDDSGRTTDAHAVGLIASCVAPLMQTWRFPHPKPAPASFSVTLKLVTDGDPPAPKHFILTERAPIDVSAPLGLVVSASPTELLVWSLGGKEGTLPAPKLRVSITDPEAPRKVRTVLADIANRNFGGRVPEDQRGIMFTGSGELSAATYIPVLAAMHSVFPDVVLSSGFE